MTRSADHKPGSGRRHTARTDESIKPVEQLVLSQENVPEIHRSVQQNRVKVEQFEHLIKYSDCLDWH